MSDFYVLNGHEIVPADMDTWGVFYAQRDRRIVAIETLPNDITVSTMFLGKNMGRHGDPPVLFETLVLGGPHDKYSNLYTTWEKAEAGHQAIVQMVRDGMLSES